MVIPALLFEAYLKEAIPIASFYVAKTAFDMGPNTGLQREAVSIFIPIQWQCNLFPAYSVRNALLYCLKFRCDRTIEHHTSKRNLRLFILLEYATMNADREEAAWQGR